MITKVKLKICWFICDYITWKNAQFECRVWNWAKNKVPPSAESLNENDWRLHYISCCRVTNTTQSFLLHFVTEIFDENFEKKIRRKIKEDLQKLHSIPARLINSERSLASNDLRNRECFYNATISKRLEIEVFSWRRQKKKI